MIRKFFRKKCHAELISSFRDCEAIEESHEIRIKRFFGRLHWFDLNRKFNAFTLNNGNRAAFTLAEVLITLTIIGVIAALTILNLMQSYKKHQAEARIKEAYSILSNAIKMSEAENGSPDDWVYSNSTDFAGKYIIPHLKINYICTNKTPCFDNNGWTLPDGTSMKGTVGGYGSNYFYKAKLQNGMDLGVWAPESRAKYGSLTSICFIFDVNGNQGKSIVGKDVFAFSYVDYSRSGNPKIGTLRGGSCLTNNNDKGYYNYTSLIFKNGWKIPEDYPIKRF